MTDKVVLCGANSYEQKYYFNEEFQSLPQSVKDELHIYVRSFYRRCRRYPYYGIR